MDQATTYLLELAAMAAFIAVFVLFWRVGLRVLARWGKWNDLADSYRAENEFMGPKKYLQGGRVGTFFTHNGSLVLGADTHGLQLSVFPLFRHAHPPLQIPWAQIATRRGHFPFETVVLTIRSHPSFEIRVSPSTADFLTTGSKGAFQPPPKAE